MEKKILKKNKSDIEDQFLSLEKDLDLNLNKEIFKSFFSTITNSIKNKKSVELRNFGTFKVKKMSSRIGSNPKNQEKFFIPEKNKLTFKLSKKLFDNIND